MTADFQRMVGKRVKKARKEKGWTQAELTEKMGIANRQTIQQMEAGQRKVMADELMKLMELTGQDLDYFTDPYQAIADEVEIHIDYKVPPPNPGVRNPKPDPGPGREVRSVPTKQGKGERHGHIETHSS